MNNISVNDVDSNYTENVVYIQTSANNVTIDSVEIRNISADSYYEHVDNDEILYTKNITMPLSAIVIEGNDVNLTLSGVVVENVLINKVIEGYFASANISDVKLTDSSMPSGSEYLFKITSINDVSFENVLVDNISIVPVKIYERNMTKRPWTDHKNLNEEKLFNANPGFNIVSNKGKVYLNNINITNSNSNAMEGLFNVYSLADIVASNIIVQNITEKTKFIVSEFINSSYQQLNNSVLSGIGSDNSIMFYSSDGNVNITELYVSDVVSDSIRSVDYEGFTYDNLDSSVTYCSYFLYVQGNDVTANGLTVNNAVIGGYDDNAVFVSANDNLNVDDFTLSNVTSNPVYLDIRYWGSYDDSKYYQKYYLPLATASVVMSAPEANISNINLYNVSGQSGQGLLCLNMDNLNLTNVSISNIESNDAYFVDYDKNLRKNVTNSVTADHGMGYSTEINVECSMNANLKGINISSLNVFGQGYWNYLMSVSGNNISVEDVNVEHVHEKELRTIYYYDKSDSQLYDYSIGNYAPSILIEGQDVRFINFTASDVDSNGGESFVQIEGVNVTFENASVIDSKLLTGYYGLIKIEADDHIEFNNVLINNITGVTPHNYTYHKDYYDESGNYAFTGTYYDYQSASGDVGVGIYLEGYCSINMTNVNITNSCGGDMPLIGAGYSAGNVYFNNILIENISSFYYESITFKEKQQKYVTDASFSETRVFELSSGSNLTIYNMKVINIDRTTGECVAEIDGGNVIMENVTFLNWDSEPGVGNLIYDPVTGEYLYEYLEYHDCEEFVDIMAEDGDVNMTNVVMDRIPAPYDSSYIGATRVNIVNSTFKNMYCTITYYRYNLTTHKYDLTDSSNEGVIFEIEAEDYLRIVNSTVENISTAKYALGIDSNNVSFINTTFKDIHAELLDHDDYYHEYSDVTHGNSFKIKRNSNAVLILDSRFINCTADYGGALYIDGTVRYNITNTTFESNKAIQGGAIYINATGAGSIIFNTTFIENLASNNGGAIYILETAEDNATVINQSTFIGNHADHDGGAFFYNDTQVKFFFCDYEWFNRTAMFSDGKLNLNTKTGISDSLFENNTDYALIITVKDIDEFKNQTVIISIDVNATGEISVNVTDENGQFITDINGNLLKDKNFTLVNGKMVIELGKLAIGKYNVSAYYNNYNSQYDLYHDYAYHLNSTVFGVHKHIFNVDANDTIFVDENVTVTVELNNLSTGTVNITISNETDTFTFTDVPIVNGTAKLSVGEFLAGKYNVSVAYAGDEIFPADSNQTSFEVIQRQAYVNVTVEDVEYKNNAVVIVKVPLDQKGNVTIKINNVEYTKEITNGLVEFVIENLTVQKWEVNVTFAENRVYKSVSNRTEFNVLPIDLNANVTAQNITVLDNPTFAIEVPQDFKGNVSITVDGKTYNGTVKDIVELEKVLAGNKNAVVEFYGDENYKKLTLEIPFEVERTSSAVEVKVDDVTYPETAVALINVSGMANGTVEIKIGDKTFTGTVSNGVAKVNLTGLNAGVKDVSVRFITNDDYNADGSNTTRFTVFKVESFVIISNDGDDIVVTLPQNATGEVVIYIDGKAYPVSVEDHKAILKDILKIGNNSVVAAYAGDDNYFDSINVTNLVLNKLKSSLNASAESVTYGEDVIVTVNVPSIQTGSVTITVDGKNYTSEIKDGKSEFTISDLSADNYEVKVYYSGDDVYEASQNVTSFTVNKKDLDAEVVALNITVDDNYLKATKPLKSQYMGTTITTMKHWMLNLLYLLLNLQKKVLL